MKVLIDVLLGLGVALVVFGAVGVLLVRDAFARLHYLTPASTLGIPLVSIAVILDQGTTRISLKVGIVAVLMLVAQPAVTAATGRAMAAARGLASSEDLR